MKGKGFSRRVRDDNLESFRALLHEPNEGTNSANASEGEPQSDATDPEVARAEELFGGTPLSVRPPYARPRTSRARKRRGKAATRPKPSTPTSTRKVTAVGVRGPILWKKVLEASDCESQEGHGTGGMRLAQAEWRRPDGKLIDKSTYFRQTIFGRFSWFKRYSGKKKNLQEETFVDFHITARGRDLGVRKLKISDMQSRAAKQDNYTTMLHWSGMTAEIRALNLRGSTLSLYGPTGGTSEPFFIDVT